MIGISGGHQRATVAPVWAIADIAHAATEVRTRGGSATDPHHQPYGTVSECSHDQGLRFSLVEL